MPIARNWLPAVLLAAVIAMPFALAGGCVGHGMERLGLKAETPKVQKEVVRRERPGYVWVDGHWIRRGSRWVWQDGYWTRGKPGYAYVPGRWVQQGTTYAWVDPYWRRDRDITNQHRID